MNKRVVAVAAVLLVLAATQAFAGYGLKWTLNLTPGNDAVVRTTPYALVGVDVNGDSLLDVQANADSGIDFYSGCTHQLLWPLRVPAWYAEVYGNGNADPDPSREFVVRYQGSDGSYYRVYDCATHTLEFETPTGASGSFGGFEDVDGDGMADLCVNGFPDGFRVYGWIGSAVGEKPPSEAPEALAHAMPVPASKMVQLTIPFSVWNPRTVTISDASGRVVKSLEQSGSVPGLAAKQQGRVELWWDCRDDQAQPVPAGRYFYRAGTYSGKIEVVR